MVATRAKHWMNWAFLHTGKSFLESRQKTKLTFVVSHHFQMQLSNHTLRVYHTVQEWRGHNLDPKKYGFFDFDAKLERITYTEPLACTCAGNLLRPFFATAHSLLANQVNAPVKTFSYTVMNCVVAQIIVLTNVPSMMRSTLTLKETAIKLTYITKYDTDLDLLIICSLLFYIVNIVLIIIVESYYVHCCCIYL